MVSNFITTFATMRKSTLYFVLQQYVIILRMTNL